MTILVEAPRPGMPYAVQAGLLPRGFAGDEEVGRALRDAGRCQWVTAYGMPWIEWCGARVVSGEPFCEKHLTEGRHPGLYLVPHPG